MSTIYSVSIGTDFTDILILFLDPNIPETGEQSLKSNRGPDSCCYQYCDLFAVYNGICPHCNFNEMERQEQSVSKDDLSRIVYDSSVTEVDIPPQECQLVPGLSLTSSRCEIPYYASSASSASSSSLPSSSPLLFSLKNINASSIINKRVKFLWTISWILLILIKTNIAAWTYTFSVHFTGL